MKSISQWDLKWNTISNSDVCSPNKQDTKCYDIWYSVTILIISTVTLHIHTAPTATYIYMYMYPGAMVLLSLLLLCKAIVLAADKEVGTTASVIHEYVIQSNNMKLHWFEISVSISFSHQSVASDNTMMSIDISVPILLSIKVWYIKKESVK